MSTNETNNSVAIPSLLSDEMLDKAGIKLNMSPKVVKAARTALIDNGATLIADSSADKLYVLASMALRDVNRSEDAKRTAAIELAIIDKSGAVLNIVSPSGKPYKSAHAFFKDVFPSLSKSTISNYLGVGRDIYLKALSDELTEDKDLNKSIFKLPPSQALVIKGALNNDKTKDAMVKALSAPDETIKDKDGNSPTVVDTLTYSNAKAIVSKVKEETGTVKPKEARKDTEKAVVDEAQQRMNAAFHLYLNVDNSNDEFIATTAEQYVLNFHAVLKDAVKDGTSAIMAIKAIANAYGLKV